ncbi:MAG: FtsX-like permease family protein [Candidatus Latescibacteria bacterium]|nr:FtsX-like permease family protein [Candidatus Latescibacterota bacterium]
MKKTHADMGDFSLHLLPLADMYLNTEIVLSGSVSNPKYTYILSGIALLVLFIACINFVNLSTGQSGMRAREVGVRKIVGATRAQLMNQFWGESILLSVFALGFGVAFAELLLPTFNGLLNQKLDTLYFASTTTLMFLLVLILFVGLAAGSLPALVLSRFHPVAVIKGRLRGSSMGWLRRGLVLVQFALSIFLVVSTVVMSGQLHYIRNKNLGFNPAQVISVDLFRMGNEGKQKAFRNAVLQKPAVLSSTNANLWWHLFFLTNHLGESDDGRIFYGRQYDIDYDFFKTFEMELVAGRNFTPDRGSDLQSAMIVNEALVRQMGWDDPLGKRLPFEFQYIREHNGHNITIRNPEIIGVVKDFHLHALHHKIQPVVLLLNPNDEERLAARIRTDQMTEVLSFMRSKWKEMEPNVPFSYSFIDEKIASQYRDDERWGQIIRYAAVFAIFVACLGVIGLTALAVARHAKEIGIRKVFGASEVNLLGLFSREFLGLVVAANLIAWPVAYYAMDRWLQNFAYRIELGVSGFLSGGLLIFLVVLLTVNLQVLKAVRANPVDALHDE